MSVIDPKKRRRTNYVDTRDRGRQAGASPHGGKIFGLKFVDQVRELGIDDPTKLFSAARRTRKHVGTDLQEVRSTKLRQHKAAAVHGHAKLRRFPR